MKPFLSEAFLVFMHWCLPLYTRCHSATRHIALAAFKKVSILACLRVIRLTQNWNQPFYQVFATWVTEVSSWIFFSLKFQVRESSWFVYSEHSYPILSRSFPIKKCDECFTSLLKEPIWNNALASPCDRGNICCIIFQGSLCAAHKKS